MTKRTSLMALTALAMACGGGNGSGDPDGMMDGSITLPDMEVPDLPDAGADEGVPDEGVPDIGPELSCAERGFGINCNTVTGCRQGICQPALQFNDIGGDADPVQGLPGGGNSIPGSQLFDNGFCTLDSPFEAGVECGLGADVCGECMSCVTAFNADGCYLNCDPDVAGNDICPDAWDCVPLNNGGGICFDGCATDTDCFGNATIREETNGVPGIQTGADCEEIPSPCGFAGPDQLVFIPSAMPTCNLDTFECEVTGDATAEAGDACRGDVECEDGGACQAENVIELADGEELTIFEGGYCFGPECDSDDDCNGAGVCGGGRSGAFLTGSTDRCLERCDLTVGVDTANVASWPTGRGGCDEGYKCLSDANAANPELGVCVPDRVDPFSANGAITQAFGSGPAAPNLGAACTSSDECFNPFGYGTCITGLNGRDGFCSVGEAGILEALGFDVCTGDAIVVNTSAPPATEQECLPTCTTGDDCPTGFGCISAGTESVCFPTGCADDTECRSDEECIAGGCFDTCRDGATCGDGLGCLPLNSIFNVDGVTDPICFDVCQNDEQCSGSQVCAGETADTFGQCITECADATECAAGEACVDFDGATGGERECRDTCVLDGDCRAGETCDAGACTLS
ncbi:MAG: hypothetical protein AAF447_22225 [Myxococcota bacterium]